MLFIEKLLIFSDGILETVGGTTVMHPSVLNVVSAFLLTAVMAREQSSAVTYSKRHYWVQFSVLVRRQEPFSPHQLDPI